MSEMTPEEIVRAERLGPPDFALTLKPRAWDYAARPAPLRGAMSDRELNDAMRFHHEEALAHRAIFGALEDGTYEALMAYTDAHVPVWWVAERLGVSVQVANNRLRKLVERGVCRRRREGAIFVYHWIARVGAA